LIQASRGDFTILNEFLVGLLIGDEYDQTSYLFGWLKIVYEALLKNAIRPAKL